MYCAIQYIKRARLMSQAMEQQSLINNDSARHANVKIWENMAQLAKKTMINEALPFLHLSLPNDVRFKQMLQFRVRTFLWSFFYCMYVLYLCINTYCTVLYEYVRIGCNVTEIAVLKFLKATAIKYSYVDKQL